jgi:thioredoxin reductase
MNPDVFPFPADVAVVGGSAAALNAALILGRAGRRVVLFDDGDGHGSPTAPDHGDQPAAGESPAAVRRLAREHLAFFGVRVRSEPVIAVRGADGGFGLLGTGGWVHARKLLLATGLIHGRGHDLDYIRDLPLIPGLADGRAGDRAVPFVATPARQGSPLVDDLGCARAADGRVRVDAGGRTTIPGVAAAGEMTTTATAAKSAASALIDDLARQDATARVAVSLAARPLAEFSTAMAPVR